MTRVDPHVKVLSPEVVRRAKRNDLDALVYAPHFEPLPEIERTAERFSDDDLLVVPGREIFTGSYRNRKHVLAVGLDDPVPDFVTLEGAMAEFRRQDATVLAPHPEFFTVGLTEADLREYRDVIDAIEVYNPKHWPRHNRRAKTLACDLELPAFGSSYAHLPWTVGDVWTEFDRPIDDAADLRAALGSADKRRVCRRSGIGQRTRKLAEFSHLFFENSWKKFDRVVLSGRETTHPDAEVYGGRFDDVAVYDESWSHRR